MENITATSSYLGSLRVSSQHQKSGTIIETDAPVDNNGKGTRFSPTDLVATAYLDCMITIIGIYCDQHQINFQHCEGKVEKIMRSGPRRIGALNLALDLSKNGWDEKTRLKVEAAAKACPVAKSVHPEIQVDIQFKY